MSIRGMLGELKQRGQWLLRWPERRSNPRRYVRDMYPMHGNYKLARSYTSIAILDLIVHENVRHVAEIGVFRAQKTRFLLDGLLEHRAPADLSYAGFDLFSTADASEIPPDEAPLSEADVASVLRARGVSFRLYAGFTSETLPRYVADVRGGMAPCPDFAFIDGGHSYDTCKGDFLSMSQLFDVNPKLILVFDDGHLAGVQQVAAEIARDPRYFLSDIRGRSVALPGEVVGLGSLFDVRLRR